MQVHFHLKSVKENHTVSRCGYIHPHRMKGMLFVEAPILLHTLHLSHSPEKAYDRTPWEGLA